MKKLLTAGLVVVLALLVLVSPALAASSVPQAEVPVRGFWVDLLENLLIYFLPILASALLAYLYAQFRLAWAKFKAIKPDVAWMLEQAAAMAVKAAEQAGAAGYIHDKKLYALMVASKWLKANGVPLDMDLIDAAIEAAVFEELNRERKLPAGTGFVIDKPVAVSDGFVGLLGQA